MADSLDAWISRRLESYAQKHGLDCSTAVPGKLVQIHKWLTFESPYWARVGDSELAILAVFSDESALKYQTQTGRSITSLRRAVLRLTAIRPTLILPFAKAQTRDVAFDVLAFTVMNSGGEHEPIYYDRVKNTSRELEQGHLRSWVDGIKRKYNQVGLGPIQASTNANPTEPFPPTRPALTLPQPSSPVGCPTPTLLPPLTSPLSSSDPPVSESKQPPKTKPRDILDLSWWIIPPDQQILLDAIDEPSRPRPSPSWFSVSSHLTQPSQTTSSSTSAPEKSVPPTNTTDPPAVAVDEDQDSEEELSIRKPRAVGANASAAKGSIIQPTKQAIPAPETASNSEPTAPPSPPILSPPKSARPTLASTNVDVAAIVAVDMDVDTSMTQEETEVVLPKERESEKSPVASQTRTTIDSSPGSAGPSVPPPLSQPQLQSRPSPQQHSSTVTPQHVGTPTLDKQDDTSRTDEAQDGTKKPLGRASSTVLVPNSDTDSLSQSQSVPLSWPPTEPPSSQSPQTRPPGQPQSFSPPRPSTQLSVSGSQTQLLSQSQTQSPSQPTERSVPPITNLPSAKPADQKTPASRTRVEPTPATALAATHTTTNVNPQKRPVPDDFSITNNGIKKVKTAEPTVGPKQDQGQGQGQGQVLNQTRINKPAAAAAAAAINAASATDSTGAKTWSTVPMLRTGQPMYPDHPSDTQPTQAGRSETIEFSQMPDTQQREAGRAALVQGKVNTLHPLTKNPKPILPTVAAGLPRPTVPLSAMSDLHNGKKGVGQPALDGRRPTNESPSTIVTANSSSTQLPLPERSPVPTPTSVPSTSTSTATSTPPSAPIALPVPAPAAVPISTSAPGPSPVSSSARPARKVFKLQRALPLAPGLPSETDVVALLREAKKWSTLNHKDKAVPN